VQEVEHHRDQYFIAKAKLQLVVCIIELFNNRKELHQVFLPFYRWIVEIGPAQNLFEDLPHNLKVLT
jgi:hypothetical protein